MTAANDGAFRSVRGLLLDITGVLKDGRQAIAGSVEAVRRLRNAGLSFRFVTNETQIDRKGLVESLRDLGFSVDPDEVFSPAPAVAKILKERGLRPYLLVHPDVLPEFESIDKSSPNCVVVGDASVHFTYENVNEAFKVLIKEKDPVIIAMGKGKYYKEDGELTLDLGGYVVALEYACDAKAEVIGKPAESFFRAALNDLSLRPDEVMMIGDDLVHDVGGAQACGMRGVLVRTGKYRTTDENHPVVRPDAIVDDLAAGVELVLKNQ